MRERSGRKNLPTAESLAELFPRPIWLEFLWRQFHTRPVSGVPKESINKGFLTVNVIQVEFLAEIPRTQEQPWDSPY